MALFAGNSRQRALYGFEHQDDERHVPVTPPLTAAVPLIGDEERRPRLQPWIPIEHEVLQGAGPTMLDLLQLLSGSSHAKSNLRQTSSLQSQRPAEVREPPTEEPPIVVTSRKGYLGTLSERFEAPGGGATISSGRGDAGGRSYGRGQMSSRMGTVADFVKSRENMPWAPEFNGLAPRTKAFDERWKKVSTRNGDAFSDAQYSYLKRTHYDPNVNAVADELGVDIDQMSLALRNVVWSTSIQDGFPSVSLSNAIKEAEAIAQKSGRIAWSQPEYDALVINKIYDARIAHFDRKARREAAAGATSRAKASRAVATNRLPAERRVALQMLQREIRR